MRTVGIRGSAWGKVVTRPALAGATLAALLASAGAASAVERGPLVGRVVDPEGQPVPSAVVSIPHFKLGAHCDSLGRFRIEDIPHGRWLATCFMFDCPGSRDSVTVNGDTTRFAVIHVPCFDEDAPLRPLPVRAADFRKYPRKGFGFILETEHGERVDTFAGYVTKDMVWGPDTTIALKLTEAELDTIYREVIEIRAFEYPQPLPESRGITETGKPSERLRLTVACGPRKRVLSWTGPILSGSRDFRRLGELVNLIRRIVSSHPAYMALPKARGGRS